MSKENTLKHVDANGVRWLKSKFIGDRCSTIPVIEFDYPEITAFRVENKSGNRYYVIPKDELISLYKEGKIVSFFHTTLNGEHEELISELGNPKIPKSGYGAHFKCIQVNRSFK